MNILPKKRWHVRTKDNIAKVRRDEAAAAEEERKRQQRVLLAEREARAEALRKKAREQYGFHSSESQEVPNVKKVEENIFVPNKHVNLFYELEHEEVVSNKPNEEHEKEKRLEKEKYEKQIGYLVYLGQDTNELTGNVSWYNKLDKGANRSNEKTEVSHKQKVFEDPLQDIRKYLRCEGVKKVAETNVKSEHVHVKKEVTSMDCDIRKQKKKHKKKDVKDKKKKKKKRSHKKNKKKTSESDRDSDSDSDGEVMVKGRPKVDLERLRNERLRRELKERQRAQEVFARLNGVSVKKETTPEPVQKYNSQFNPHIAKQNFV